MLRSLWCELDRSWGRAGVADRACVPGGGGAGASVACGARGEGTSLTGSLLQGCGGRPEWKLITGWEECTRESWVQGVYVRDVLSANLSRVVVVRGVQSGSWS